MNVLVVDDQRTARRALVSILEDLPDIAITEASSLVEARAALGRARFDVALVDLRLSDDSRNRDGHLLVRELVEGTDTVPICVTATGEMQEIRTAMRNGAYDYILKDDLCEEVLVPLVEGLRSRRRLESEVARLRARVAHGDVPSGIVGGSDAIERLRLRIARVALSDRPCLVTGPTGAGKEVVVQEVHRLGAHPEAPLLDLNCGAIPEQLMEAQLFGYERGAFTGAERRTAGYLAVVADGTLFLDEIAELPLALQAKLLRVIETRRFRPVGSTAEQRFEGRVVAATHADLRERARLGTFREDLMFRLTVLELKVPALDQHPEDIPALIAHFVRQQPRSLRFDHSAIDALTRRSWPGNARQLRTIVDRLAVFADDDLVTAGAVESCLDEPDAGDRDPVEGLVRAVLATGGANKLQAMENALMREALQQSSGNKARAGALLGVHRKVVERWVARQGREGDSVPPDEPED